MVVLCSLLFTITFVNASAGDTVDLDLAKGNVVYTDSTGDIVVKAGNGPYEYSTPGNNNHEEIFQPWTGTTPNSDVAINKEWKIRLNQPINEQSLTGNIYIKNNQGIAFSVSPRCWEGDSSGKTVLVSHNEPFAYSILIPSISVKM